MIGRSATFDDCRAVANSTLASVLFSYVLIRTLCFWLGVDQSKQSDLFLLFSSLSVVTSLIIALVSKRLLVFCPSILGAALWFYICHAFDLSIGDIEITIAVFAVYLICLLLLPHLQGLVISALNIAGPWYILVLLVSVVIFLWSLLDESGFKLDWLIAISASIVLLLSFNRFAALAVLSVVLGYGIWLFIENTNAIYRLFEVPHLALQAPDAGIVWGTVIAVGLILVPAMLVIFIELFASYALMIKSTKRISNMPATLLFSINVVVSICTVPLMVSPYHLASEKLHHGRSSVVAAASTHLIVSALAVFVLIECWPNVSDMAFALMIFTVALVCLNVSALKNRISMIEWVVLAVSLAIAIWFSINVSMTGWLSEAIELPLEYVPFTFLMFYIWLRYALSLR